MTYKQSAQAIIARRKRELDEAAILFSDTLAVNSELYKVEIELRNLLFDQAKGVKIDHKAVSELQKKKTELLNKMGLTPAILHPAPHCRKCADTAHSESGYCECVKTLSLSDQKHLEIPCQSFSEIDFNRFDSAHRERNKQVFATAKKICEKYPEGKRKVIVLFGATGTGKTLLSGCCATEFLSRGLSVVAVTAFGFVNRCLKYHTSFDDEKLSFLEPLLDADLLIIDDLGTESILKNITHEYLYSVLNERMVTEKLTLVTANLSQEGILTRYGERIYSRLFNKELGYCDILNGKDIRTL